MLEEQKVNQAEHIVSRSQFDRLVDRAGEDAVKAALIQNGSEPDDVVAARAQKAQLIERAGENAVKVALIQNGSDPDAFHS